MLLALPFTRSTAPWASGRPMAISSSNAQCRGTSLVSMSQKMALLWGWLPGWRWSGQSSVQGPTESKSSVQCGRTRMAGASAHQAVRRFSDSRKRDLQSSCEGREYGSRPRFSATHSGRYRSGRAGGRRTLLPGTSAAVRGTLGWASAGAFAVPRRSEETSLDMRFEGTVTIGAPRDRVWRFLTDLEAVGQCAPGVESIEIITPLERF